MTSIYQAIAPSNIALLKYWGKRDVERQWAANNSLSMTLQDAKTITRVTRSKSRKDTIESIAVLNAQKSQRALKHVDRLRQIIGERLTTIDMFPLAIHTENHLPSDAGFASSASGFAALTTATLAAWFDASSIEDLGAKGISVEHLARLSSLGSGSAGRSIQGGYVLWSAGDDEDSQYFKQVFESSHWQLSDTVFCFSSETKKVSSSEGHRLARTSPFFEVRLAGLVQREERIKRALAAKDLSGLGEVMEDEALEMHMIAATSRPSIQYLNESALEFMTWLRTARKEKNFNAYFTLDAGSSVHVISELSERERILECVPEELLKQCVVYKDSTGAGTSINKVAE